MKILSFTLAGALASFGESSRWDNRDTSDLPTKSAVIGLVGCCMGLKRGDARLTELSERLHIAVRRERAGRVMTDFHTVQGPNGVILNAERKPRGSTIITPKQYVQDAVYQVFLYGDEDLLDACAAAMRRPKWVLCLGRRSCPPSVPVLPNLIESASVEEALRNWFPPVSLRRRDGVMRCEIEKTGDAFAPGESYTRVRHDGVVRADLNLYTDRAVRIFSVKAGEKACI